MFETCRHLFFISLNDDDRIQNATYSIYFENLSKIFFFSESIIEELYKQEVLSNEILT